MMPPTADAPDSDEDDAAYTYSLWNLINKKNNMTPNTNNPTLTPPILVTMMLPPPTLSY